MGCVRLLKVGDEGLKERPQLEQWVMARLAFQYVSLIVGQMNKLHYEAEAVTLHYLHLHVRDIMHNLNTCTHFHFVRIPEIGAHAHVM